MKKSIALLLAFILVFCGNVLVLADTTQEQVWDTGAGHSITIEIPRSDPGDLDVQNKTYQLKASSKIKSAKFTALDGAEEGIPRYTLISADENSDGTFTNTFQVGANRKDGYADITVSQYKYQMIFTMENGETFEIPFTLAFTDTAVIYIVKSQNDTSKENLWNADGKLPFQVGAPITLYAVIADTSATTNNNYEIEWYVNNNTAEITQTTNTTQFNGTDKTWIGSSATVTGVSSGNYVEFGAKLFINGKQVNRWYWDGIYIMPSASGTPEENYWRFPEDGEYYYGVDESRYGTYYNENEFYGDDDDRYTLDSPKQVDKITFSGGDAECFDGNIVSEAQIGDIWRTVIQFSKKIPKDRAKDIYETLGTITFKNSSDTMQFNCWVELTDTFTLEMKWDGISEKGENDSDNYSLPVGKGDVLTITATDDSSSDIQYRYEWWIERGQGVAGFTSEPGSAASNRKPITNPTTEKSNSVRLYGYEPGAVTVRCKVYGEKKPSGEDNGWQDNWTYVSNIKVFSLEESSVSNITITNAINDIKDGKNTEIVVPKDQSISKEQLKQLKENAKGGTVTLKSGTDDRITMSFDPGKIDNFDRSFTPLFTPVVPPEIDGLVPSNGEWVTFAYSGDLPAPMTIRMKVGIDFPKDKKIILWRYLDNSGEVVKVETDVERIEENGEVYAEFTLEHFSSYAIYPEGVNPNPNQGRPTTNYRPQTSSSSGGGGGSSSSSSSSVSKRLLNSSALDNINAANHTATAKTVSVADATSAANKVADQAKAGGKTRSYVRFVNPAAISKAALDAIQKVSTQKGVQLSVYVDTIVNNVIVSRMYIDPAAYTLSTDLKTSIITNVPTVKGHFNKYFKNKLQVVGFTQQGSLGTNIAAAVKLDFSGMDTSKLILYSYDVVQNRYSILSDQTYFIDVNGYLHFTTSEGNYIIISEGQLH